MNASWPFATLTANADKLTLANLGTYEFSPSQVVAIEAYGSIPFLASGIRIQHNRPDYPEKVVFWRISNRDKILRKVLQSGFSPSGHPVPRASGFPIRWSVVIAVIAFWNVLFMLDMSAHPKSPEPGPLSVVALLSLFALATPVRTSSRIQGLVLSEGHQVGEIKSFVGLLQLVAGALSLGFGAMWLSRAYAG